MSRRTIYRHHGATVTRRAAATAARQVLGGEKIELEPVGSGRNAASSSAAPRAIDRLIGGDAFLL
jgi:hypothetical protein